MFVFGLRLGQTTDVPTFELTWNMSDIYSKKKRLSTFFGWKLTVQKKRYLF